MLPNYSRVYFNLEGGTTMMVFGKKCPTCGGKRLIARPPVSRLAVLPTARAYACADCQQQMVAIFPFSIGVENRHFARKQLPSFFLVRISGNTDQYARINNISEGGLCFDQHYNATPLASHFFKLDLYNCNDGSSLEQLPAEIVATTEQLLEINGIKTTILNNCARFVNLNQAQKKVLHTCLAQHGR
jgi:hypothetical protein